MKYVYFAHGAKGHAPQAAPLTLPQFGDHGHAPYCQCSTTPHKAVYRLYTNQLTLMNCLIIHLL